MAEDPDSTVPVPSRHLDDETDDLFRTAPATAVLRGAGAVFDFAYGAWGFVNAIGCVVAMEAVRSGAWTPVLVWFGAAAAWNACLFRSRPVRRRAKVA